MNAVLTANLLDYKVYSISSSKQKSVSYNSVIL